MCKFMCAYMAHVYGVEDNLQVSLLSSYHVDSMDQTGCDRRRSNLLPCLSF